MKVLIERYKASPIPGIKRPDGYVFHTNWLSKPVRVVGSYETACGGCDAIQPYSLIWPRVVEYADQGHVLFEGALVSSSYGNIGRDSVVYGDQFVFAFLDTPLKVCLDRISLRRKARGDFRPLDPKNTEYKYNSILKSISKIKGEFNRRVVMIDHKQAVSEIMGLLRNG